MDTTPFLQDETPEQEKKESPKIHMTDAQVEEVIESLLDMTSNDSELRLLIGKKTCCCIL
jgi:hypothetical protein